MATQYWSTPIDHNGDTGFRAWGSELSARLQAAGLVQTSDTGQVNWLTVTRPSSNVYSGYEIYQLDDSLSGARPIFLKFEYGTGGGATVPSIRVTVGNGSNGSGTLTGLLTSARPITVSNGSASSSTTDFPSWLCVTDGFIGLFHKSGMSGTGAGRGNLFSLTRTCDDDGVPTTDGATCYFGNTSGSSQKIVEHLDFVNSANYVASDGSQCVIPGSPSSSLVGLTVQVYRHMFPMPRVRPVWSHFQVLNAETSANTTFETIPVGTVTPRTYICLGANSGQSSINLATASGMAMLWE